MPFLDLVDIFFAVSKAFQNLLIMTIDFGFVSKALPSGLQYTSIPFTPILAFWTLQGYYTNIQIRKYGQSSQFKSRLTTMFHLNRIFQPTTHPRPDSHPGKVSKKQDTAIYPK